MRHYLLLISICLVQLGNVCCEYPSAVRNALLKSGDNRPEIEGVLNHYKNDEQKYRAAVYLIENMPGHRSCDTIELRAYYDQVKRIINGTTDLHYLNAELEKLSATFLSTMTWHEDITYLDHQYLIRSIDRSFDLWENTKWARHLSFDQFCEYLLPYKVNDFQYLDDWKYLLSSRFEIDTVQYDVMFEYNYSNQQRATHVNQKLKEAISPAINFNYIIPLLSADMLEITPFGRCEDYSNICNMVMRSKGIPVAYDSTPQWAGRSYGHAWNVLFNKDGRTFDFAGISGANPGEIHLKDDRPSKIYRTTYAPNKDIAALLQSEEYAPDFVHNLFQKDVTADYVKTVELSVKSIFNNRSECKYGYLAVFDNTSWISVAYGKKRFGRITFKDVPQDIIYLPVLNTAKGVIPVNYPLRIDYDGSVKYYIPDTTHCFSYEFTRKYPIRERMYYTGSRWIGGEIQVANRPDFSDAIVVHKIERFATELSVITDSIPPRRYWRYVSAPLGHVFVSEMIFMDPNDETERMSGQIIGTDESWLDDPQTTKEAMFDGDLLTRFDSKEASGAWAGIDFGHPVKVSKIIMYPASDGNSVEIGDQYELSYFDKTGWVSLGTKIATDMKICFDGLPANAVYLLDDITKGKEKRIFTIEKDRLVWW